uniref:Uncharacterized protein n=1 Tax=Meloidogyne hapla TaxID=6305 RepID=A0A1I8BKF2_MELHA
MEINENNFKENKKQLFDNFKIKSVISSSLPNWKSKYLLNRINSFEKISNKNNNEDIRKSPQNLLKINETIIPTTQQTLNNSTINIETLKIENTTINTTTTPLINQTLIETFNENI